MAFPSNTGTKRDDLTQAWLTARTYSALVRRIAGDVRTASSEGTLTSGQILGVAVTLADGRQALQQAAAVPGIAAYAQQQINDPALNLAAEFTAMVAQIDACRDWIAGNFPKDGSGYLLAQTLGADGRPVDRVFTAPQTATFRSVLDALLATID